MTLRGYFGLAIIALILTLAASLAWQSGQASKYRKLDAGHRACIAAIGPKARPDAVPAQLCDPVITRHWIASSRSAACDQALSARPEDTHGARASCSTAVQTLAAQRNAARSDLEDKTAELARETGSRKAAIARAAADASAKAERKVRREAADEAAVRDADGRTVCDAQCLRIRTR